MHVRTPRDLSTHFFQGTIIAPVMFYVLSSEAGSMTMTDLWSRILIQLAVRIVADFVSMRVFVKINFPIVQAWKTQHRYEPDTVSIGRLY
jgi:hypothetical protein